MRKAVSKKLTGKADWKPEYNSSGMMMPRILIICSVIGILCFLMTAGCQAKQSSKPFSEKDACTLLTKEEVEAALKWTIKEPQLQVSDTGSSCVYENQKSGESLWVNFLLETDPDLFKKFRDETSASGMKVTIVEGIGDSAYFFENRLNVMKKKYEIMFYSGGSEKLPEEALASLAKIAVARIP